MEKQYLNLLHQVILNGDKKGDRTGVGTLSIFGAQLRHDLKKGFPAITTKKLAWKAVVGELLWFLEGSGDERRLAEITHGTREEVATIWTLNALAPYWKPKAAFPGDLGRVYGVQWRRWKSMKLRDYSDYLHHHGEGGTTYFGAKVFEEEHDQIASIVETLKTDPSSRRMVLTAFNVGEIDDMALPPCHMFCQFYCNSKNELSCQVYIRSNDLFLGLPFNIASYALLTHMIAQVTGKGLGELIISIGDAHIYLNHVDQVKEQLTRTPLAPPQLALNPEVKSIDDFKMGDIQLLNYESHPPIKAPMAV